MNLTQEHVDDFFSDESKTEYLFSYIACDEEYVTPSLSLAIKRNGGLDSNIKVVALNEIYDPE